MSHLTRSLNGFLDSKKFVNRKRSISRSNSQRSLNKMNNSSFAKRSQNNVKDYQTKWSLKYEDSEDNYYEEKEKKIRRTNQKRDQLGTSERRKEWRWRREENEEEYQEPKVRSKMQQSFQSSKREAKTFVESLARKINLEIGKINNTIEEFNKNLRKTIDFEYSKLRAAIKSAVQLMFEQEEDNMKKLVKIQEKSVNQQLSQVRSQLESMYSQLQKYKDQLQGPNWKKITGQILSSDLEITVDSLIKRSQKTKSVKNLKISLDPQKQQAFSIALEQLLQIKLSIHPDHPKSTYAF